MKIRLSQKTDLRHIQTVLSAAFKGSAETSLVEALERDGDQVISLIAVQDEEIIGHIMLSAMRLEAEQSFKVLALAPVAVHPNHQNHGIGSALIKHALTIAKSSGWQAVFLLGDPKFYSKFSFSCVLAKPFTSPYAGPYFMALALRSGALSNKAGAIHYAPAFAVL